ncbi:MAG: single-stranded DNA-binding protein [Verrucomicrobia bacterium]|nr:single-stranded DNA-binding protein [Verrucomicrobiota bacterium]MDA1087076.1 single-stranded DNA-binding protein [Verrucomicrobiota bacterium]
MTTSDSLIRAAKALRGQCDRLTFALPVTHVYNPLDYAWKSHEQYLRKWGSGHKRVIFMGMNPGPWGMAQTGVPFGEVALARDWLGIDAAVKKPPLEHPKRPIEGFACKRSEVSGRRLWGYFSDRFGTADHFFADHFVVNYCPLVFMEDSGRNRTPDKLPQHEQEPLLDICNTHLEKIVRVLEPEWLIGVGAFARTRCESIEGLGAVRIGQILHPSPASPAANRGWADAAEKQLLDLGVW